MATQLQIRRGTNTQNASFTGAEGELSANTTNDSVHVHDGSTAGGFELARADLNNVSDTDLNSALTGNTLASLTITSADINGGTIDGTVIGGSTAAAGTFTTFTSNGIDDNADATAITIDSSENVGIGTNSPHSSGASFTVLNLNGTKGGSLAFSRGTNSATKQWAIRTSDDEDLRFEYGSTLASEAMRIDSSGNLGVGETSPDGLLHIKKGNSGTSYSADAADQLILENSGTVMMDIRTPAGNTGGILFSDAGARGRGVIQYAHSNDTMYFNAAGTERFRFGDDGKMVHNGLSGTSPIFEMINNDNEDNNTGRESSVRFSGHRSGGEDVISAQITGNHDDSADGDNDQGQLYFYTNSGSGLDLAMKIRYTKQVEILGNLIKNSGSFRIDHPLTSKTDSHYLVHSFIEGPKADLIYRGKVDLVAGSATVNVDTAAGMTEGTFNVLCADVQCFTSNESGWTAVKGAVSGNTLTITAQDDSCTDTISWMVVGERKDQHMMDTEWTDDEGKVIVEPLKTVEPETLDGTD